MQRPSGKSLYRSNSNENSNECQTSSYREISNHINNQNLYLKILRQCSIYCLEKRKKCAHKCPQKERGLRGRVDEDNSLEFRSVGFWANPPTQGDNIHTCERQHRHTCENQTIHTPCFQRHVWPQVHLQLLLEGCYQAVAGMIMMMEWWNKLQKRMQLGNFI